jgi:hypothetical protein
VVGGRKAKFLLLAKTVTILIPTQESTFQKDILTSLVKISPIKKPDREINPQIWLLNIEFNLKFN